MSSLMPSMPSQEEMYRFQQYQQLQFMQQQTLWQQQQQQQVSSAFPAQLPFAAFPCAAPPSVALQGAVSQQQYPSSASSSSQRKRHKHKHRQHETQAASSSGGSRQRRSRQSPHQRGLAADSAQLEQSSWSSSSFHHPYAQPLRLTGAPADDASLSPSTAFPTLPGLEDALPPLPSFHADGGYERSAVQPLVDSAAAEQRTEQLPGLLVQQREDDSSRKQAAAQHDTISASEAARANVEGTDGGRGQSGSTADRSSVVAALREQGRRKHGQAESQPPAGAHRLRLRAESASAPPPVALQTLS